MEEKRRGIENYITVIFGVIFLLLFTASIFGKELPMPAEWLQAWTIWLGSVVTIVVAARGLWAGGDAIREYVINSRTKRGVKN